MLESSGPLVSELGFGASPLGGSYGTLVSWVRSQAAAHPWIHGMVARLPVEHHWALDAALGQAGLPFERRHCGLG